MSSSHNSLAVLSIYLQEMVNRVLLVNCIQYGVKDIFE